MNAAQRPNRLTTFARMTLFLVGLASLGTMSGCSGPDPQLEKIKSMSAKLSSEEGKKLTSEQRQEAWNEIREEMKKLSPEAKETWRKEQQQKFREKMDK